jgi:hypothetical protein
MRDGSRAPAGRAPGVDRRITGVLPDSWCRVAFPFAPSVRLRQHERQRIEGNQPPA